jgi:hypothetical protein
VDFELNRKDLHDSRFIAVDRPSPANGEAMNYWAFVPASDPGWGKLNVWGYAHVEESRHPDLAAPHRRSLPSAYQGYRDVDTDPVYSADVRGQPRIRRGAQDL